jgi:RNA polymerase sigma factor (sigma-70 family)
MTPEREIEQQAILTSAYSDHAKGLMTYALYKLNNASLSDDLVQDTFAKTWRYLAREGKIDIMKAFLYHILNNLIVDEYRKKKRTSLDLLLEKGYEPSEDSRERLTDFLDGKKALLLIAHLPYKYQKIMRMRHVQDLDLKEMSLITGLTRNTLSVQLYRGLSKLKVLYKHAS